MIIVVACQAAVLLLQHASITRDPGIEIWNLAQLKTAGVLTEAEFNTLKARALGSGEVASPPAAAGPLSAADAGWKIERLSRLREAGHLSEGEFASLKAGVLARR